MILKTTFEIEHLSHFVRKLGHEPSTLTINGIEYPIGLLCGITTLLSCPNECEEQHGYYVTLYQQETPLTVAYQCFSCEIGVQFEYDSVVPSSLGEVKFVAEIANVEIHRLESQLDKRIEKNLFDDSSIDERPNPFEGLEIPKQEIDPEILNDEMFWELPQHAQTIGKNIKLQIYRTKSSFVNVGSIVHVFVNNKYLLLGIQFDDEMFIYYGLDDFENPESNEDYHEMIEYVHQLPKPLFLFDYDYKIFGTGLSKEKDCILLDQITGVEDITAYGLMTWNEEIKEELGPNHLLSIKQQGSTELTSLYPQTIQIFEMILVIKRKIVEQIIKILDKEMEKEKRKKPHKRENKRRNRRNKYRQHATHKQRKKKFGMREFDSPVSKFRDIIRNAGDKPLGFDYAGEYYGISSTYGETDLLPCPNNCTLQRGFYALASPKTQFQSYVQIIYQCSYCDHMIIRTFEVEHMSQYSFKEYKFIGALFNDILMKRSHDDPLEYIKRKKIDILADQVLKNK